MILGLTVKGGVCSFFYQGNILAWEENPSFNGAGDSWYFWWYK